MTSRQTGGNQNAVDETSIEHTVVLMYSHCLRRRSIIIWLECAKSERYFRNSDLIRFPCTISRGLNADVFDKGFSNGSFISQTRREGWVLETCSFSCCKQFYLKEEFVSVYDYTKSHYSEWLSKDQNCLSCFGNNVHCSIPWESISMY